MPKFEIRLSKEAGIYTKEITIEAKSYEEAQSKALDVCEDPEHEKWTYEENYFGEPFIQVEETVEL